MKHPIANLTSPIGLLADGCAPTKAYWLEGLHGRAPLEQYRWHDLNPHRAPLARDLEALEAVLVVRTLPVRWLGALRRLRKTGKPVVLLLDDALLDPAALAELSWRYRWRLWCGLGRHRRGLSKLVSELWVSTDRLAECCRQQLGSQAMAISVLPLQPPSRLIQPPRVHRLAYLGTASHRAELAWLRPLLAELQRERTDCLLELILDGRWRRRFRELPRTRVLYPMDWSTYLLDTGNRSLELLLVPLMPGAFNAGRAPVKFFDAARLGAVGLYSDRPPYRGFVRHGEDGLLLSDDPQAWLGAIETLLSDHARRQALADRCRARAWEICLKGGTKILS